MSDRALRKEESRSNAHQSQMSDDVSTDNAQSDERGSPEIEALPEISPGLPSCSQDLLSVGDVRRLLHPLQATADRIGKQVEDFAQSLDQLTEATPRTQAVSGKDSRHILCCIQSYRKIASDTVKKLQKLDGVARQSTCNGQDSRRSMSNRNSTSSHIVRRRNSLLHSDAKVIDDMESWVEEERTWELFESMMHLAYPVQDYESYADTLQHPLRPRHPSSLNKFSTKEDAWESYLASDDIAWERYTVVRWLERIADRSGRDIDQIIEESEIDSDRGSGLLAHSWLYTREAIKGQKRLRSWPRAFEPKDPGVDTFLTDSAKAKALVTQLDPDAITRQVRTLENQDLCYERAIWLACWQMIRRGKSWGFIENWYKERLESWRAAAIQPALHLCYSQTSAGEDWQSHTLWRKVCAVAAKDGGIDDFERAVYGVLSGYLPSAQRVCKTWDDCVYAHYKCFLEEAFEQHLRNGIRSQHPAQGEENEHAQQFSLSASQRTLSGNQLVEKLKLSEATQEEASHPFRLLQGSLIAGNFHDFVYKHGVRLGRLADRTAKSKMFALVNDPSIDENDPPSVRPSDYNLLRIVTHMIFMYQEMGHDFGEGSRQSAAENFVVAYMDFLGKAGKQQLLPVYAARLTHERSVTCLGRQLPLVQEAMERKNLVRLMTKTGVDVHEVLRAQLKLIIQDTPPDNADQTYFPNIGMLEPVENAATRMPSVKPGFSGSKVTDDQLDLINGIEWYKFLQGYWHHTMALGVMVYKHFLRCRAIPAGKLMSKRVPFSEISIYKTPDILGSAVDLSPLHLDSNLVTKAPTASKGRFTDDVQPSSWGQNVDSRRSSEVHGQQILLRQSRSFKDLENLFIALGAIESWASKAEQVHELSRYAFPFDVGL